jgi:aquaporin related protein
VISEFVGTVLFLLFAFAGTQIAQLDASVPQLQGIVLGDTNEVDTPANTSQLIFIALAFGFLLLLQHGCFSESVEACLTLLVVTSP